VSVFVDEVHERDLNTDFLLIILRDLLHRRPSLKLVLMSATLNAERFSEYFGGCPIVSIPGRAQPVQEYRLEDALEVTQTLILEESEYAIKKREEDNNDRLSKTALRRLYPNYSKNVITSLANVDESIINYALIADLLEYICNLDEEGAILVFLSGLGEIKAAMEEINKREYFQSDNAIIYPLHSSLSNAEQTAIFQRPPTGKRKIVLSSNIAETSITIDDVVFVIDTGRVKENRYDDLNKMQTLSECWVSKASARQRKGRAGRVKPGFCWHLYSSHTHNTTLDDYQLPEMLRVGLEDLILQILVLDLGTPTSFLAKAVDPPTELSVKNALQLLESLGAAEVLWDNDDEAKEFSVPTSLTALGYHLGKKSDLSCKYFLSPSYLMSFFLSSATIPCHPRVGKMLIYGSLFGVFDPCLTIAASMTCRNPFVSSFDNRDSAE
jgi:ATP-dependent RNA helicase DHX36